ncbi:Sec-independent protein translocase protein TatB [Rhizobium mayense]|uniref:Sec-independent protein translocase protein TatB n=1 Tax=Rhizobium mayense TaxID=1312184 RepID=A0ABT7JQ85_9HYPH|nr:Sec-independent protein translocase protein TatB [Rhizobium mayense]MDL2398503.1 Sec-independent protein translocase protein TatB [Rhizobium mayense]
MFDVGWSELLIIAIVALVVIGPKELPSTLRTIGKMTARARKVAGEFRAQFDEAMREAELDDVRQTISDAQKLNPVNSLREAMNPLRQMGNEIKADLQRSTTVDKSEVATSTPAVQVSELSMGLPETPPIVPAADATAPIVSPPPVTPPPPAATAEETPEKPKTVRRPRAKTPAKTDEVVAAAVDTSVVAEKPKRAPRKAATTATDAPAAAPRTRSTASKTTPKKKDQA